MSAVAVEVRGEALFASTHGALKFALNYTQGSLKKSTLAQLIGGGRPGKGLGGLDGAAQAGMILSELERIDEFHQWLLVARLAVPTLPCACRSQCCRGFRAAKQWDDAVAELAEFALHNGLTGTVSHYRLRRTLVARYFGVRDSLVDVAAACGVSRNTASLYNKNITELFRREEKKAMLEISGRLYNAGLIES